MTAQSTQTASNEIATMAQAVQAAATPTTACAAPFYKRKAFWGGVAAAGVVAGAVVAVRTGHLNLDVFKRIPSAE